MSNPPPGNRYDVSGSTEAQYADPAQTVLVNRRGITELAALQIAEESALAQAYELLLAQVRIDTPLTCALLQHIHQVIFGDLFEWAGRWRRVNISKPGVVWPAAAYLDQSMTVFERDVLAKHPAGALGDDDAFNKAVAEIQGEFLAIHPFREGNARTIKLATNLLAVQTGRPLLVYDDSDEGAAEYIAGASAALRKQDYSQLESIIRAALSRAKQA